MTLTNATPSRVLTPISVYFAGHLFDLRSLSGKAGTTASYSEKGLVYISVCGENENCGPGVGECHSLSCLLSFPAV